MTEEIWKNSAIITKRNVDDNQNPISVQLSELKQIIDVHSCIVLNQLPDEFHGIYIDGYTEVYDIEKVSINNYKVDYANGVIYFHPNNIGKILNVDYCGIGHTLLSASRIYTKYDKNGGVLETLEELLDKGKLYIEAIETLGGAVEVINELEQDITNGTSLHENLLEDISTGSEVRDDLEEKTDIANATINSLVAKTQDGNSTVSQLIEKNTIATEKKQALDESIQSAIDTNTTLSNTNQAGTQINLTLQQTIAEASDDIATINATGNKSLIIGASNFTNGEYTWTHSMNNDNLIVSILSTDTNEPIIADYKIIDKNNILIRNSEENPNLKVILSASYYQGNSVIGSTVEEFLGDSIGINEDKVRLRGVNGEVQNPVTNSDAVFMSDGVTRLTNKISDITDEIDEARGSNQFLGDRLSNIDASLANKIQIKKGLKAQLPTLNVGEFGLCTDTEEIFVGGNSGNIALAKQLNLNNIEDKNNIQLESKRNPISSYFGWTGLVDVDKGGIYDMSISGEPFIVYDESSKKYIMYYFGMNEGKVYCLSANSDKIGGVWTKTNKNLSATSRTDCHKLCILVDVNGNPVKLNGYYHGYVVGYPNKDIRHWQTTELNGLWTDTGIVIQRDHSGNGTDAFGVDAPYSIYDYDTKKIYMYYMAQPQNSQSDFGYGHRVNLSISSNPSSGFVYNKCVATPSTNTNDWYYGWLGGCQIRLSENGNYWVALNGSNARPSTPGAEPPTSLWGMAKLESLTGTMVIEKTPYGVLPFKDDLQDDKLKIKPYIPKENENVWRPHLAYEERTDRWICYYNTGVAGDEIITHQNEKSLYYYIPNDVVLVSDTETIIPCTRNLLNKGYLNIKFSYNVFCGTNPSTKDIKIKVLTKVPPLQTADVAYEKTTFIGRQMYDNINENVTIPLYVLDENVELYISVQCIDGIGTTQIKIRDILMNIEQL